MNALLDRPLCLPKAIPLLLAILVLAVGVTIPVWSDTPDLIAPVPTLMVAGTQSADGLPVIHIAQSTSPKIAPLPTPAALPAPALKAAAGPQFVSLMPLVPLASPTPPVSQTQAASSSASTAPVILSQSPIPTHPEPTGILTTRTPVFLPAKVAVTNPSIAPPVTPPNPAVMLAQPATQVASAAQPPAIFPPALPSEGRAPRRSLRARLFGWFHRDRQTIASPAAANATPAASSGRAVTRSVTLPAPIATPSAHPHGQQAHHPHAGVASAPPAAYDMQSVSVTSVSTRSQDDTNRWVTLQILTPDAQQIATLARTVRTYNRTWHDDYVRQMAELIVDLSGRHAVDYRLIASIIAVESSFRMNAVSPTGAMGLGQLLPSTARWLQVSNPFDPVDNATAVSRYLSYLQSEFPQEWDKAVASYFVGQGTVKRSGITPSAQAYVQRVANVYRQLEPSVQ